jgi:hypothetical protein
MKAATKVAMRDDDPVAIPGLIHLLSRHRQFVNMFAELELYEQLSFEKKELADYTLSVFIMLFERHPEIETYALVFIEVYPRKVLRLFSLLCQSFTEEDFDWDVADPLILHINLFVARGT